MQHRTFNLEAIALDPRGHDSEEGSNKTPPFQPNPYWQTCLRCGTTQNVTRAHIQTNNTQTQQDVFPLFGPEYGYADECIGVSVRNHIPLCGTRGQQGTCHHEFDSGRLTLLYDPFRRGYYFYGKPNTMLRIPRQFRPYRRLLVWRARRDAVRRVDFDLLDLARLVEGAHASDAGTSRAPASKKRTEGVNSHDSWEVAAADTIRHEDVERLNILITHHKLELANALAIINLLPSEEDFDVHNNFKVDKTSLGKRSLGRATRDRRFPKEKGWELVYDESDGVCYFNTYTNMCHWVPRGG